MGQKQKFLRVLSIFSVAILPVLLATLAHAQGKYEQPVATPLVMLAALSGLALVPIVLVMATSFIKITVVLSIVRNALGTQQIPPNQVITGLALILTVYIMVPVGLEVKKVTEDLAKRRTNQGLMSEASLGILLEAVDKGKEPFRQFLTKHTHPKKNAVFHDLALKLRKPEDRAGLTNQDFTVLVPAFIISELSEAFYIGFVIFLPFLVIDMVVANILLSLGMFQLSPITVSLPFKLLLFVLVDGWQLVVSGLITGYL